MNILSLFRGKKKSFFSKEDEERMVQAIRFAEKQTSGEVRIFVESHCSYIQPIDRAKELFAELKMTATKDRNGVLLYFAMKDRQMAIWGDEGIHQKMGQGFWEKEVAKILADFKKEHFVEGICNMIQAVGEALKKNFPYASDDKNELDDTIVFGK
ncbi:MAG: hypothetical protein RLY11_52 [Bacteroidota bacterium]